MSDYYRNDNMLNKYINKNLWFALQLWELCCVCEKSDLRYNVTLQEACIEVVKIVALGSMGINKCNAYCWYSKKSESKNENKNKDI